MEYSLTQKRNRLLLLLSGLLLMLLVFVVTLHRAEESLQQAFSSMTAAEVKRIEVSRQKPPDLVFEKNANRWYLTKPIQREADFSRIQIMLATLSLPKATVYDVADVDTSASELEAPLASLKLNDSMFLFGAKDSGGGRRYLQTGNKVTLISDIVFPVFNGSLAEFSDKSLISPDTVRIETSLYTIDKIAEKWQSEQLDDATAESVGQAWLQQPVKEILPWPPANRNILERAEQYKVELQSADDNSITLDMYSIPELTLIKSQYSDHALIIDAEQFSHFKLNLN